MQYRRISEVEADEPRLRSVRETQHVAAEDDTFVRGSRKRKALDSIHRNHGFEKDSPDGAEIEPEDDIHSFRRVHVKAQKREGRATWSIHEKHPSTYVDHTGLEVGLYDANWPAGLKAMAVHADKHFDTNFNYFEIEISRDTDCAATIGIGLSNTSNLDAMPGMIASSWGFHSDDGNCFRCVYTKTYKKLVVRNLQISVIVGWYAPTNLLPF